MGNRVSRVKGTRDILPPESGVWAAVEAVARKVFGSYGFGEVRTPVLESTELFVRSVGESTDIVGKEMYTFEDRKGRSLTLRPESTASVVRAFVENGLQDQPLPVKLYYVGPQFRYERPQRGRYRQFHQIGAEIVGDPGPESDAELILMLMRFLGELQFEGLEVQLNTVGDETSRDAYRQALQAYLSPIRDRLNEDSRRRLESNPLRILDTKDPAERELLTDAPTLTDHLSDDSRAHFETLCGLLDGFGIPYAVESRLVRGLDYYTRTVFEIVAKGLGAQDAIVGGGRYDRLVAELGGSDLSAIGFAIGEDRLIDVLPESFSAEVTEVPPVAIIPVGEVAAEEALRLAEELRDEGIAAVSEVSGRSIRSALKRADRVGARWAVLIGDDELADGEVMLRSLEAGDQSRVARQEIVEKLKENL